MSKSKRQLNCENCGLRDKILEYFEHVHQGITLCEDCADLPYSQVSKRGKELN